MKTLAFLMWTALPLAWAQEVPDPDERGKSEDVETKLEQPTKPLEQASLVLPEDLQKTEESRNLGGGLFPPELWPLTPTPSQSPVEEEHGPAHVPNPEEIWTYFTQQPTAVLQDPWHLLPAEEEGEWERFLAAYAPGQGLRILCGPAPPTAAAVDQLAAAWSPSQPLLLCWITPGPDGSYTVGGNALQRKLHPTWRPSSQQFSTSTVHWKDQARLALLQQTFAAGEPPRLPLVAKSPPPHQIPLWQVAVPSSGLAGLGLVALALGFQKRRVVNPPELLPAQPGGPWYFPPVAVETRLGGPSGGGHHARIQF